MTSKNKKPVKRRSTSSTSPSQSKNRPSTKNVRPASGKPRRPAESGSSSDPDDRETSEAVPGSGFPIVGIGASAGGFDAFTRLFSQLPAEPRMGFVLVQHLAPDHDSLIPELLARHTSMPVHTASDRLIVKPNHIYVISPNTRLTIEGGCLRVTEPPPAHGDKVSIDDFLLSLAEDQGPYAVGIILSGSGSDGTLGLRAVKEHGGLTLAQTLETARFDSMPRGAILTGLVDHVASVEDMPEFLLRYAGYLHKLGNQKGLEKLRQETIPYMDAICSHVFRRHGHDFHLYKRSTLSRRVRRRMQILHLTSPVEYVKRLKAEPEESEQLFKDFLIGVTQFLRDPDAFHVVSTEIIPKIVKGRQAGVPIRIWIPGCSTGEEAYTLAMMFTDYLHLKNLNHPLQIFATDIDERSLNVARRGVYPEKISEHLPADWVARFFEQEGSFLQVVKSIRDVCTFSVHNLIGNPPFSRMDFISCRNLLIYMDAKLQQQILPLFHYSLNPKGYLLLGLSEHISGHTRLFRSVNKPFRLFQAKEVSARPPLKIPFRGPTLDPGAKVSSGQPVQEHFGQQFDRMVRQEYGPAAILIDRDGHVQYLSGRTRTFLHLPTGSLNMNVLSMVRPDLRVPLRSGIFKALKEGREVIQDNIQIRDQTGVQHVDVIVRPMVNAKEASDLLMVVFREHGRISSPSTRSALRTKSSKGSKGKDRVILELEQELQKTREHLHATVEELESSNQELKSSNQELLSVNEELQSTIEELQTSSEELQSINEELETVNVQLAAKVEELDAAHNDIENLFRSTDIATLFLDTQLRIKKFTPAAQRIFQFQKSDIGRPMNELASFFVDPSLGRDIEKVLETSTPRQKERRLPPGGRTVYLSRLIPYQTVGHQIQGVVFTLVDITHLRQAEDTVLRFSRQQEVIAECGKLAIHERDVNTLMDECVRQIASTLSVDFVKVLELQPGGQSLLLRAGLGWKDGLVGHAQVSRNQNSQAGYTLEVDQLVVVTDLSEETRFSGPSLLTDHGVVSGVSCLIRDREGRPYGVLGVHTAVRRDFSEDEIHFMQTMAQIIASALQRKGIENQLESMKDLLEYRVQERTRELLDHQQRVRQLSSELILVEQAERRRIANELHDYLAQLLVVAKMKISRFQHDEILERQVPLIQEIDESLDEALHYTRDLISQISPPILYEFGLVAAIRWLADKMVRHDLHVTVTAPPSEDEPLPLSEPASVILYHILRELLLNVVKHAQTTDASIVMTRPSPDAVRFEVTDRGCGFDWSAVHADLLSSQKFGLLNVQERIEDLGGQFEVCSSQEEGTRVRITVPGSFAPAAPESSEVTAQPVSVMPSSVTKHRPGIIRVMLADDHPMFRDGLRTLLIGCPDIQVVGEAKNGREALTLVQSLCPDVVIMDINMPVMNGIEATRRIKELEPSIFVIGLSMHSDHVVRNSFSEAGGDQYVSKGEPFTFFAEIIRSSRRTHGPEES